MLSVVASSYAHVKETDVSLEGENWGLITKNLKTILRCDNNLRLS